MNIRITFCLLLFVNFLTFKSNAQSTFGEIYTMMQSSCVAGCHGGASPDAGLDLSGAATDVYANLINQDPNNASATAEGYKLVRPNHPEESFLLHKLGSSGFDSGYFLTPGQGTDMPKDASSWPDADIELVRQWILYGAKPGGNQVDKALLEEYYTGEGLSRISRPAAPSAGQGYQIHHGPIFLQPGEEIEVLRRFHVSRSDDEQITRLSVAMNEESHHFILYRYDNQLDDSEGIEEVDGILGLSDISLTSSQLGTWQYDLDHELPTGTAYFWDTEETLNLNYHVRNYNTDSVMAAEVYINVYTEPAGSQEHEMIAELELYGGSLPFLLNVPNTGVPETIVMEQFDPTSTETYYIWLMQAHTHQLGVDYDVYLRNSDGSKGDQIYEGFYNEDYTFNQGFYDFAHPPVRKFEPYLEVKASEGLIHEATYLNTGPSNVGFGLTTADEMFITYYHYTLTDPTISTGTETLPSVFGHAAVMPNPFEYSLVFELDLEKSGEVSAAIFDLSGKLVAAPFEENLAQGRHTLTWPSAELAPGMYILQLFVDGVPSLSTKITRQ